MTAVAIDLIPVVPAGVRLRFTGDSGRSYQIERAPSASGPWSTVATPTAPLSGDIQYVDANLLVSSAFYRIVQP